MKAKNIVVFGDHRLAFELIERLNYKQHQILFADIDPEQLDNASKQGFETRCIDYRVDDDLKTIGIGRDVDLLFCFFNRDCDNVFLILSARAMDPELEIIAIVDAPDSAEKLVAAGANKIINPYIICGRKIYERYKKPDISQVIEQTVFRRHDLNLAEIVIPEGSCLENTIASDFRLTDRYNLILIGVVDKELSEELHFAIGAQQHKLDAGDILVVMGPVREIKAFKKDVEENLKDVI